MRGARPPRGTTSPKGPLRRRGPGAARPVRGMLGPGLQNGQPQGCARYGPARPAPAAPGSAPALPGLCSIPRASLPSFDSVPAPPGLREPGVGVCALGWGCARGVGGYGRLPPLNSLIFSHSGVEPGVRDGSPRSFPARFPAGKLGWWFGMAPLLLSPPFPTGKPSRWSGVVSPLIFALFSHREAEPVVRGGSTVDFSSPFPTRNPTVYSLSLFSQES